MSHCQEIEDGGRALSFREGMTWDGFMEEEDPKGGSRDW